MSLAGRRALVTGGASGIGLETARLLRDRGAAVAVLDAAAVPGPLAIQADVTDPAVVDAAFDGLADRLGGPADLLVNAAGVYRVAALREIDAEAWDAVLAVNLRGAFLAGRAFATHATAGAIVNVSSIAADRGDAGEPAGHYAASKAGLVGLTRQMAAEWAPGIRVNAVNPGVIDTPMLRMMDDPDAGAAYLRERVPLQRLGTPADVARVIAFLLSDDAAYVTGAVIPVDGGVTAS